MWALFSTRLRRWLLIVIGVPLVARLLHRLADVAEARRGPQSKTASTLRSSGDLVRRARPPRRRRGLLRRLFS